MNKHADPSLLRVARKIESIDSAPVTDDFITGIWNKIDQPTSKAHRIRWWWLGVPALAVAALALLLFTDTSQEFTARGTLPTRPHFVLDVGLEAAPDHKFHVGAFIPASYQHDYVMIFAADSANQIHWLYPAYESVRQTPRAWPLENLPRVEGLVTLPDAVQFDDMTPGIATFYFVVAKEAESILPVEAAAKPLRLDVVRNLFPEAIVQSTEVEITP